MTESDERRTSRQWEQIGQQPRRDPARPPGRASRIWTAQRRFMRRIGLPLGRAVGAVAMLPGAAAVCVIWLGQRLAAYDLLSPPVTPGTRWVRRTFADPTPASAAVGAAPVDPRGSRRGLQRVIAGLLAVAVVAGVVALVVLPDEPVAGPGPSCVATAEPAVDEQGDWPGVGCEATDFAEHGRFDAVTAYRYADYSGEWVHVRDGVRRTWTPPPCDCRVVRVWWFGGSAAWGWHQSDTMSLPSQVARAAWEDGVALEIVNHAMPGWVLGQGVQRFGDLTTRAPAPDLVVFYDGANDLARQVDRNAAGRGADESDTSFAEREIGSVLDNGPFDYSIEPGELAPDSPSRLAPAEVARHAMDRYARNVRLGVTFASAASVTPRFFFQPTSVTAPLATHDPTPGPSRQLSDWTTMVDVARTRLPDSVTDLSDVLDGLDHPVFTDLVHTNEEAAGVIAASIWEELRTSLPPEVATGNGGA